MQKISIMDYVRILTKDTQNVCAIVKGDLVKLHPRKKNRKSFIGIVTQVYDDKMCLLISNNSQEWWSRYVKCEILSYNNR